MNAIGPFFETCLRLLHFDPHGQSFRLAVVLGNRITAQPKGSSATPQKPALCRPSSAVNRSTGLDRTASKHPSIEANHTPGCTSQKLNRASVIARHKTRTRVLGPLQSQPDSPHPPRRTNTRPPSGRPILSFPYGRPRPAQPLAVSRSAPCPRIPSANGNYIPFLGRHVARRRFRRWSSHQSATAAT